MHMSLRICTHCQRIGEYREFERHECTRGDRKHLVSSVIVSKLVSEHMDDGGYDRRTVHTVQLQCFNSSEAMEIAFNPNADGDEMTRLREAARAASDEGWKARDELREAKGEIEDLKRERDEARGEIDKARRAVASAEEFRDEARRERDKAREQSDVDGTKGKILDECFAALGSERLPEEAIQDAIARILRAHVCSYQSCRWRRAYDEAMDGRVRNQRERDAAQAEVERLKADVALRLRHLREVAVLTGTNFVCSDDGTVRRMTAEDERTFGVPAAALRASPGAGWKLVGPGTYTATMPCSPRPPCTRPGCKNPADVRFYSPVSGERCEACARALIAPKPRRRLLTRLVYGAAALAGAACAAAAVIL